MHPFSMIDELVRVSWAFAIAAVVLVAVLIWLYLLARRRMLEAEGQAPWSDAEASEVEVDGREP